MPKKAFGWSRRYVCWAFELPKLAQVAWGAQGGNKMDFIIITGMSGAGKSRAVDALEDIGFFCVDNIPPKLIRTFAQLNSPIAGKAR